MEIFHLELYNILYDILKTNDQVHVYKMNSYSGNTLSFNIEGLSSSYVASELSKRDICVRSGFHCSPLAHKLLNTGDSGAVRIGIGVFNTKNEIYTICDVIDEISKSKKIRHWRIFLNLVLLKT